MTPRTCKWHKCRRKFTPLLPQSQFCSPECQKARAIWKSARGSTLVDPVIDDNTEAVDAIRQRLLDEIKK